MEKERSTPKQKPKQIRLQGWVRPYLGEQESGDLVFSVTNDGNPNWKRATLLFDEE